VYVFLTLAREPIPANDGVMRRLRVDAPAGSVVNADFPAAVAGGNVVTSQRIVDVLLRALAPAARDRIPAASQGSMNNLAIGGFDRRRGRAFAYYETLAGGAGAGPTGAGASGIHTHMTNTLNTPIEALEAYYPFLVTAYGLRSGSGGRGRHRGGDGVVREIRLLEAGDVTLLTERRRFAPWGLAGGGTGRRGRNILIRGRRRSALPGKINRRLEAGDTIRIETPGGGGFGTTRTRRK
jgi:N-methylhydantoinase B